MLDRSVWEINYREPICGGNRVYLAKVATLMDAVASFNLHEGGFDTPLSVKRIDIDGQMTDRWCMDGRYAVPRHVESRGSYRARPIRPARRNRRRS